MAAENTGFRELMLATVPGNRKAVTRVSAAKNQDSPASAPDRRKVFTLTSFPLAKIAFYD
jgi:hypothetical protein